MSKLQELTDKIYKEGVEKANNEARQIIAKAQQESETILKAAQKEANEIIEKAGQRSNEIRKNVQSEVKLASQQAISSIKQKIVNLITAQVVEQPVTKAFEDTEFLKKIIVQAIENWKVADSEHVELSILLPKKQEEELQQYFLQNGNKLIKGGLEVNFEESMKGGFKIGPKDGSFKISFTDDDFENFFKTYLRPRTIRVLYGGE